MIEDREVVFKLKIDHKKVHEAYDEYKTNPEKEEILDEQAIILFEALLCSTYVYVPESQVGRFIKYGQVIG